MAVHVTLISFKNNFILLCHHLVLITNYIWLKNQCSTRNKINLGQTQFNIIGSNNLIFWQCHHVLSEDGLAGPKHLGECNKKMVCPKLLLLCALWWILINHNYTRKHYTRCLHFIFLHYSNVALCKISSGLCLASCNTYNVTHKVK